MGRKSREVARCIKSGTEGRKNQMSQIMKLCILAGIIANQKRAEKLHFII